MLQLNETLLLVCTEFYILIHSANPQSRPVGIIVLAQVVRPSVRTPLFKSSKTKQQKTMFAIGETVGLAEWIIDDTCLVYFAFFATFPPNS